MANNRLYLVDTTTAHQTLLAKGFGFGWELWDEKALAAFLEEHDKSGAAAICGPTSLRLATEEEAPSAVENEQKVKELVATLRARATESPGEPVATFQEVMDLVLYTARLRHALVEMVEGCQGGTYSDAARDRARLALK